MATYRVLMPYTESPNVKKVFTVEYTIEADDRASAQGKAETEFHAYTRYNSASWVRILQPEGVRVWKLMPDLPQTARSIDALRPHLASQDPDVLYNTLRAIGELEDASLAEAVLPLVRHANAELAALTIETLGKLGQHAVLPDVLACWRDDAHPRLKACVLSAVGRLAVPSDPIQDVLARALGDPDTRVRANAVEVVERLRLPDAARMLLPLMHDEDNRVRANVLKALWRSHDRRELVQALEGMVADPNHWMRASAAFVLRHVDVDNRLDLLARLLDDSDPQVAGTAGTSLLAVDDPAAVPVLLALQLRQPALVEAVRTRVLSFGARAWEPLLAWKPQDPASRQLRGQLLDQLVADLQHDEGWFATLPWRWQRWRS